MLAYRHAFHAGNAGDVLKHLVLVHALAHLAAKEKGFRIVDTHAGAGGYALDGRYAQQSGEAADGIARLWGRSDLPPAVATYVDAVKTFNASAGHRDGELHQYPGSPALALAAMRPQDELRLFELHPTDHRILASFAQGPGVQVAQADGFASLKSVLPPPTRRGLVLIDPPYELKTDYARTLAAFREALTRFPDCVVVVWVPELARLEARQLPQRLKASAATLGKKGWLHARLSVAETDARGFGMTGSHVVVANPPHPLATALKPALPWLAGVLANPRKEWTLATSD